MATSETAQEQPAMMQPQAQKEHKWLQKLVGEWTYEAKALMGPDFPLESSVGTESVRSIGDLWVQCEGRSKMPDGSPATMLLTIGYDIQKKRFTGSWVGSMMAHMYVYDGELDASERVLTLNAEGPDFEVPGKTATFKDVIELKNDDERVLTSHVLADNGEWQQFMEANYKRKK